jgi:16S rRNA A1518/A1519 N6-dimethyltransferase RsmA/KsgA/DIM1 with predicted DNA glycosylase/AP lyase activity
MMELTLTLFIVLIVLVLALSFFYIIPWLFGAPYDFTWKKVIREIIKIAKVKKGQKVVDLGSGDGRIVIAFAQKGAEAHGYEINPFLVWYSRYKIRKAGLKGKAFIHWKNFWKVDFGQYDKIVMFQFSAIMEKLGEKFKCELKKGAVVISYYWEIPTMKLKKLVKVKDLKAPKMYKSVRNIYVYEK